MKEPRPKSRRSDYRPIMVKEETLNRMKYVKQMFKEKFKANITYTSIINLLAVQDPMIKGFWKEYQENEKSDE